MTSPAPGTCEVLKNVSCLVLPIIKMIRSAKQRVEVYFNHERVNSVLP